MESLLFVYENVSDFIHCYSNIKIWKSWNYFEFTLDQFIQLVNCTPANEKYSFYCGSFKDWGYFNSCVDGKGYINSSYPSATSLLYWCELYNFYNFQSTLIKYHWVKTNKPLDLQTGRCDINYGNEHNLYNIISQISDTIQSMYNYHCGVFNLESIFTDVWKTIKLSTRDSLKHKDCLLYYRLLHFIGQYGDIQLLESFFKQFELDTVIDSMDFYQKFIGPIVTTATYYGQIDLIKFINSNYPQILNSIDIPGISKSGYPYHQSGITQINLSIIQTATKYNCIEI